MNELEEAVYWVMAAEKAIVEDAQKGLGFAVDFFEREMKNITRPLGEKVGITPAYAGVANVLRQRPPQPCAVLRTTLKNWTLKLRQRPQNRGSHKWTR